MKEEGGFRFTKEERITGKKRIEFLFTHGRSVMAYPLRVVYLETTSDKTVPLSMLVSIPKKRLRSAVHRNRMKRLIREAYRLNKPLLHGMLPDEKMHVDVAFIYVKDELSDFATIEKSMLKALNELKKQMEKEKC